MAAIIEISHLERDGRLFLQANSTCGPAGHQQFEVAEVVEQDSPNPGIIFQRTKVNKKGIVTLGMAEKIVAYVKERPWDKKIIGAGPGETQYEIDGGCLEIDGDTIRFIDNHGNTGEVLEPGEDGYEDRRKLFPFYPSDNLNNFFNQVAANNSNEPEASTLGAARDTWEHADIFDRHSYLGQDEEVGAYDGLSTIETNGANVEIDKAEKELDALIALHGRDAKLEDFIR